MRIIIKADVKRYKPKELAAIYGISLKTFNRNIKSIRESIGKRDRQQYSIIQVVKIFDHLDRPYKEYELDDNIGLRLIEKTQAENICKILDLAIQIGSPLITPTDSDPAANRKAIKSKFQPDEIMKERKKAS